MAIPYSSVIESSREEFLSGDFNRLQGVASAGLQNLQRDNGRSDDSRDSAGGYVVGGGSPLLGADLAPTLIFSSGFSSSITQGQGYFVDGSATFLNDDTSDYAVLRWDNTVVTFAVPDATNARIDLVIVTPGTTNTDLQSRNILLDPTTRTVAPAVVPKRANPNGTVSVVTGTPAASPVAPALPGGTVALLEIWVPPSAPDASTFLPSRRLPRRATFPVSTFHGVLQDCKLFWGLVNEATTPASIAIGFSAVNKVVIDGEVLAFPSGSSANSTLWSVDAGANNPFLSAAPADNDKPYYIYACGGQHLNQGALGATGAAMSPVVLVESLIPPGYDGRPVSPITTPRGATRAGALYIGVGWVVKNSTRRKGCSVDGDWVRALTGSLSLVAVGRVAVFNDDSPRTLANSILNHLLPASPVLATSADLYINYTNSVSGAKVYVGRNDGTNVVGVWLQELGGSSVTPFTRYTHDLSHGRSFDTGPDPDFATATINVAAFGYTMNVKRYNAGV